MININRLLLASALCLLSQVAQAQGGAVQSTAMQLREAGPGIQPGPGDRRGPDDGSGSPSCRHGSGPSRRSSGQNRNLESLSFDKVWLERIEFSRLDPLSRNCKGLCLLFRSTCISLRWVTVGSTDGEITADVAGFASLEAMEAGTPWNRQKARLFLSIILPNAPVPEKVTAIQSRFAMKRVCLPRKKGLLLF